MRPLDTAIVGFVSGRQTMEITETIRAVLRKCCEWRKPVIVGFQDVRKAFENINGVLLDDTYAERGLKAELRLAMMEIASRLLVWARINGVLSEPFAMQKGGVTGGTETPSAWNSLMNKAVCLVLELWRKHERGFVIGAEETTDGVATTLQLLVWVDNCVHFARNWREFTQMVVEFTQCIRTLQLAWKPQECEALANDWVPEFCDHECATLAVDHAEIRVPEGPILTYKRCTTVQALGVSLDKTGKPSHSVQACIVASKEHFGARRLQMTARKVPLVTRLVRWASTVRATFLHNAGGWTPSHGVLHLTRMWENW